MDEKRAAEFMMPVSADTMALAAIIESQRVQTKTLERQIDKIDKLSSNVAQVREDIAVMKVKDEQVTNLTTIAADLSTRVGAMELRNAQQDGAGKLMTIVKDFAPWVLGIGAFVLALAGRLTVS